MTARRLVQCLIALFVFGGSTLIGQSATLSQAQSAFEELDFPRALTLARQAMNEDLTEDALAVAFEIIGYSLGGLDSTDQAVQALQQLIVLDPERELDDAAFPERLVNLYTRAFGQVLVVRHVLIDSASFIVGDGRLTLHYEVSRPARARVRVIGNGLNVMIDSQLVDPGNRRLDWDAVIDDLPLPAGGYQVIVEVQDQRSQYAAVGQIQVGHSVVDTVAHVDRIDGFDFVSESRMPPRDWRPLGVSALLTGLGAGAALALSDSDLSGSRRELIAVSVSALGVGLALSLRKPEPQPIPEAIQLNALIRQQIAAENQRIAAQNDEIRRRVRLSVVQVVTP